MTTKALLALIVIGAACSICFGVITMTTCLPVLPFWVSFGITATAAGTLLLLRLDNRRRDDERVTELQEIVTKF